ncbi:MAG: tail fiber domain-containing protein [Acidobacteriota bacterium]
MIKIEFRKIVSALMLFGLMGIASQVVGQTVTADIVQADRLRSNDTGNNGQFWERTEDSQNTMRYLYGPLSGSPAKVDINNPLFQRLRITGRGSLISVGRTDLGADVALPTGAGGRMMWSVVKRAFRAGAVGGNQWDDVNVGQFSFATGADTKASGNASTALGNFTTAGGIASTALGFFTRALGNYSTAMGYDSTVASGEGSVAIGYGVRALGFRSFILGSTLNAELEFDNPIPNSLMIGFNSDIPTFFVGVSPGFGQTGSVGIGTTNTQGFKLFVNGSVAATGFVQVSDVRLKANIRAIDKPLEKILHLQGIKYEWKREASSTNLTLPAGTQVGFSAQEVEQVLPEVVSTGSDGYKAVSYQSITAVMVEGMKEQQKIIDQQQTELTQQKTKLAQQAVELEQVKEQLQQMKTLLEKLTTATSNTLTNK